MLTHALNSSGNLGFQLARVLGSSNLVHSLVGNACSLSQLWKGNFTLNRNLTHAAVAPDAWYNVRQEERLELPEPQDSQIFHATPNNIRFTNILTQLRTHYPDHVWQSIGRLFPDHKTTHPLCVDIALGAEGRGAVEISRRFSGYKVIAVEPDPQVLARTFQYAQSQNAYIELISAKVEHSLLHDASAELVTVLHGLHLVDTSAALREAWRLLKPHGKLVAAWNDRDLSSSFVRELEDIIERHIPSYNRLHKQRSIDSWSERLQEGGLFRLVEYSVHPNPVFMPNQSALLDVLDCMSFVRAHLRGEARDHFNMDVQNLLEDRVGKRCFTLPMETKMYVLEKVEDGEKPRHGKHGWNGRYHHHNKKVHHLHHNGQYSNGTINAVNGNVNGYGKAL